MKDFIGPCGTRFGFSANIDATSGVQIIRSTCFLNTAHPTQFPNQHFYWEVLILCPILNEFHGQSAKCWYDLPNIVDLDHLMSLEFLKPKTHEMRVRMSGDRWTDWWPCSSDFAEKAAGQDDVEVREKEKTDVE